MQCTGESDVALAFCGTLKALPSMPHIKLHMNWAVKRLASWNVKSEMRHLAIKHLIKCLLLLLGYKYALLWHLVVAHPWLWGTRWLSEHCHALLSRRSESGRDNVIEILILIKFRFFKNCICKYLVLFLSIQIFHYKLTTDYTQEEYNSPECLEFNDAR